MRPGDKARDHSRVGRVRPSDLLFSAGIGALVDLPRMSVVVRGLDYWDYQGSDVRLVNEPRLLQRVRQVLGPQVRELRPPPLRESQRGDERESLRVGVPVAPFPRWLRCSNPQCSLLAGLNAEGNRPFELYNPVRFRPDLARFIHADCQGGARTRAKAPTAIAARFVLVCEAGHLDDFPYSDYTHHGSPCSRGVEERLKMHDPGSSMGSQVTLTCACGARRTMTDALRHHRMPQRAFLPVCRGRHPHLGTYDDRCDAPVRAMVLGASNQWFGLVESALSIPQARGDLERLVDRSWARLRDISSRDVLAYALSGPEFPELARNHDADDIWQTVQRRQAEESAAVPVEPVPLLAQEYEVLCDPAKAGRDPDFTAIPVSTPRGCTWLLDRVVRVERLRETRALIGFTRVEAPEWGETDVSHRAQISRRDPDWVPAAEMHGEGIFLALRRDLVGAWDDVAADSQRMKALREAHVRWRTNRRLPGDPSEKWPGDRYLLLHTLSHLLIREIALECGYSAASIRERLYANAASGQCGILLYTAASDSEGTLGGLVRLAADSELERIIEQALATARRCSSDPLCGEHLPVNDEDSLHGAACHACLFASETTCENGNRFLDRALVVDLNDEEGLALESMPGRVER
jgi:hypothetical protein